MIEPLLHQSVEPTAVTVASDLEGTLTAGQTWQGMRDYLIEHEEGDKYRRFYRRQFFRLLRFKFKWIDDRVFKEQWILDILNLFKGYSHDRFTDMSNWVTEKSLWPERRRVVVDELQDHLANGRRVIIVSGFFEPMLAAFVRRLGSGFEAMGTPLLFTESQFTGQIAAPLNVGDRKVARLRPNLNGSQLFAAYGDTKRDIPMLKICQHPVAVHPDETLRKTAVAQGWRILENDE